MSKSRSCPGTCSLSDLIGRGDSVSSHEEVLSRLLELISDEGAECGCEHSAHAARSRLAREGVVQVDLPSHVAAAIDARSVELRQEGGKVRMVAFGAPWRAPTDSHA